MSHTNNIQFKTKARILNQLGEQLIKTEGIALLELIKNAYDADATYCHVIMENITNLQQARIIIEDDGCGMDAEVIKKAWLEIGTSYKQDLLANETTKRTPKFHRTRLGEKGIGRFGVHRLGNKIDLYSRRADSKKEVHLHIDWLETDNAQYIEEIPISLTESQPTVFTGNKSGTYMIISELKGNWSKSMVRDVARSVSALNSPFEEIGSFTSDLKLTGGIEEGWLNDIMTFSDIKEKSLYAFSISLSGTKITKFHYEFTPWTVLNKLKKRLVEWDEKDSCARMVRNEPNYGFEDINISDIGEVSFQGIVFDLDPTILKLGIQDKRGFKEYLQENGGVRVYRDNMRVLNYGEKDDDWLDLNFRRVNQPVTKISRNVIIAAVSLSREQSKVLVEKANREGFLQNDAFERLRSAVLFALGLVEAERKIDKDSIRRAYNIKNELPSRSSISELRADIEIHVKDKSIRRKMQHCIDRIESNYQEFANSLLKSAGAGLNLTMVIHQMEKVIKNIQSALRHTQNNNEIIEKQVESLARLVEGYSILVRNSERKQRNLKTIIDQSIFNVEFRFSAHGIEIEKAYENKRDLTAICTEGHTINALLNLFDNSIWWLSYSQTKHPKIYVDVKEIPLYPNSVTILVADNGPGFLHEPYEDLVKPFISFKPNGMGIGLHLTDEIMKALGGHLEFPNPEDIDVPKQYINGAIIALVFPKEA